MTSNSYTGPNAQSLDGGPTSVGYDGTNLYVTDQFNGRILVWTAIPTQNQAPANLVLGQPNLTSSGGNNGGLSAQSLSMPVFVQSDGTRLCVAETNNNRVLIWNALPTANQAPANTVLGQPNMALNSANDAGVSATTLSPYATFSDGTRLYVADYGNNRVLIWNTIPTADGTTPDIVLGQPNMTSNTANNGGISAKP